MVKFANWNAAYNAAREMVAPEGFKWEAREVGGEWNEEYRVGLVNLASARENGVNAAYGGGARVEEVVRWF